MSIEPTCDFCNTSDKFRCKTLEEAEACKEYQNLQKIKREIKMSKDTEKLVTLSTNVSRTTIAVIDAIAQRGGFKGEELLTIGQLRDQCSQMIQLGETIQADSANTDKK